MALSLAELMHSVADRIDAIEQTGTKIEYVTVKRNDEGEWEMQYGAIYPEAREWIDLKTALEMSRRHGA